MMHQLKGYVFKNLSKENTFKVIKETENGNKIILGYLIKDKFYFVNDSFMRMMRNKKEVLLLENDIERTKEQINAYGIRILKSSKQRKEKLENVVKYMNRDLTNYQLAATREIDYSTLLTYLSENKIEVVHFNEALIKLNTDKNLMHIEDEFKRLNIHHLFNENYFKLYSLCELTNEDKTFNGSQKLLTKNIVQDILSSKKKNVHELIDFTIEYDYFIQDDDGKKVALMEQNLKNLLLDKEMFAVMLEFYLKHFVKFTRMFGIYNGVPYFIYNNVLFIQNDEESIKEISQLLFSLSLFD